MAPRDDPSAAGSLTPVSRALPLAIALLLAVVVADLLTGGSVLTIIAVTLLAAVAFALVRAATVLARERDSERAERARTELLARSGELLGSSLDPETMLSRIAELAVPDHAELAIIDLLELDGSLRGAVVTAADPELARALQEVRERFPLDRASSHPTAMAIRTGEPQLRSEMSEEALREYTTSDEHFELTRRSAYRSALVLPLVARGRTLGALSFLRMTSLEPFGPGDVALAHDLARRAALGLDNARLHTELRRAEGRLEAIVENLGEAVLAIAPDGNVRFANQSAAELLGLESPDELMRHGGLALLARLNVTDERESSIAQEDLLIVRALAGEEPPPRLHHVVDRAAGTDRWLLTRAVPVLDVDGAVDFVVWVGEDMTAVKRQEMRERLLSNASKLLGSSLDVDATLDKAAWAVVPELADWARVDLVDERGGFEQVAAAHRDFEKVELLNEWRRDFPANPEDDRGPWEVLRTGRSIVWSSVNADDVRAYAQSERHAELMELIGTRSVLIVPMVSGERVIGTIELATTAESGRTLGAADLEVAEELARRAAIAVDHARVHAARTHIATTLQRSLLPPRLPVIPGLAIAARFRAAGTATEVGGDFYDLFEARAGRWMVMMGDVTGKGPGAAAITSLARYTMRTVAQYEDDPREMLGRLNATLGADVERRQICTAVCVGVVGVDDETGAVSLQVVCAGHPSPLLVGSDGVVRAVGRPGTLLGAFPEGRWTVSEVSLTPGSSLVLYTDGVTDTRGPEGRFGAERLESLLTSLGPLEPDEIAGGIDRALQEFGEQRDDVAVLVLTASGEAGTATATLVGETAA
ncbi:SpoIIE family protein phosphatase [Conexibacter woesei]|uniref:SpoIIE family protein phosphatase n=1 Tax=Conexibacter woesei TaxID=191495 RepID=UPI0003F7E16C|nr:SpoIIE family protein phosphatase [Conexibacter woesei]